MAAKGKEWQRARRIMQPDILSPKAAASYLPMLPDVLSTISNEFPNLASKDLDDFCMRAVFDMFSIIMLGKSFSILTPDNAHPVGLEFAVGASKTFRMSGELVCDPKEKFFRDMNISTAKWTEFSELLAQTYVNSAVLIEEATRGIEMTMTNEEYEKKRSEEDTDEDAHDAVKIFDGVNEKNSTSTSTSSKSNSSSAAPQSYLNRLVSKGAFTVNDAALELPQLVFAGVDTTSVALNWCV